MTTRTWRQLHHGNDAGLDATRWDLSAALVGDDDTAALGLTMFQSALMSIALVGTWNSATIALQGSLDNGETWLPIYNGDSAVTFAADGCYNITCHAPKIRLVAGSDITSVDAVVCARG